MSSSLQDSSISFIEMENVLTSMNEHIDTTKQKQNTSLSSIQVNSMSATTTTLSNSTSTTSQLQLQQQLTSSQLTNSQQLLNTSNIIKIEEMNGMDKSRKYQKKQYIIKTKCGQLELTFDRILSFIIMLLAITTLLTIAILSTGTIFLKTNTENKTFDHSTRLLQSLIRLNVYYNIIMKTKIDDLLVDEINEVMTNVVTDYKKLLIDIPYYGNTAQYSRGKVVKILDGNYKILESNHGYLYNEMVQNGKRDVLFYNSNYYPSLVNFTQSIDLALILADKAASNEDDYMNLNAIIDLSLVGFVLVIIIPSIVVILIKSAVNDNKFMEKLQKADARIVIETISDIRFQSYFKELCQEHSQLSKFLFMERVQSFNEICQTIFTLQDEIEDGVTVEMSKTMLIEIDNLEAKKFELAFEIITEYLDSESDTFLGYKLTGGKKSIEKVKKTFDSQSMNLPENLFKTIQSNVSMNLIPIYRLFKSNQERKRNERRGKIIAKQQIKQQH